MDPAARTPPEAPSGPIAPFERREASGRAHLFFDLDGTLTDPREGITRCLQHALRELGELCPPADELVRFIGPPLVETFAELLADPGPERVSRAVRAYRERFASLGLFENRVIEGVPEMLDALAGAGRALYLVTSKPEPFARRIVDHFGLSSRLRGVHGSLLDGRLVHKHDLIAHVLRVESIPAEDAVMIGDREHDVLGARRAGVASLAVAWGYGSRAELEAARPDALVETPAECAARLGVASGDVAPDIDRRDGPCDTA